MDRVLFQRLQRLMLILIPTWRSKEFGILTLHTFFLVFRTALSVYLAYVDGHIVGHLVNKDAKEFGRSILWWLVIAVPATYTNAMIKFLESKVRCCSGVGGASFLAPRPTSSPSRSAAA